PDSVILTNNNSTIKAAMVPPNDGLKSAMKDLENGSMHEFDKDVVPSLGGKTAVTLQHHVPLMDPKVVDMLVEKMRQMKEMKQLMSTKGPNAMNNGKGVAPEGGMPNGTTMDGKLPAGGTPPPVGPMPPSGMAPSNGQMPPNGMTPPNGLMPPNGMAPPNGPMPPKLPKLFGSVENAIAVVRHMKAVFNSQEIQDLCDEKMDPSERNIMFKMMQCKLAMEFKVLHDLGMLHLAHLVATGKLPHLLQLVLMGYHDEPEVMKELNFIGPLANLPSHGVRTGDPVPNIALKTCAGEMTSLNDVHVNKDRPLVVFAASSS
ncbi:uncharacterized protein, partial [Diadema setosum]|uniref:uncharacterized protein n=1 Tax=Diadema setosum TaxID=31175 RepID=UPI003B3BAA64